MHEYWDKQPVSKKDTKPGEIDISRDVHKKTTKLPDGFMWSSCNIKDASEFLSKYYVEAGEFKLCYPDNVLRWSIDDSIAIRKVDTKDVIGFIASSKVSVKVESDVKDMVQIDYLCIHPSYRTLGLAPILISEIKRRANKKNIWQAIYTAHAKIPTPMVKSLYWHRFLDVKYLVKSGFHVTSHLREKYYEVRGPCKYRWRKMTTLDVPKVTRILQNHIENFKISPNVDEEYVKKWLLPIHSYVNDENDYFISFYDVPYERIDNAYTVKQAYRYFIVGEVYNDAFLIAKNMGFHVFNTLDVGLTCDFLNGMKFVKGTGYVYYYLFNWHLSNKIESKEIEFIIP